TTTPMMCAYFIKPRAAAPGRFFRAGERVFDGLLGFYDRTLQWALRHALTMMLILLATLCLNVYLFVVIPKGFFPQQDTGRMIGGIQADQSISFQSMRGKLTEFISIILKDPAIESVVGFTGGAQTNSGFVFASLKPRAERDVSIDEVIGRLRRNLAKVP